MTHAAPRPATPSATCHACGADLTNVSAMTCPACGARPDLATPRAPDAPPPRHELARPVALLALALAALAVYLTRDWAYPLPTVLAAVALQTVLGLGVFIASTLTWLGADDPMPLNLLRLLSIYAATWALLLPVSQLPLIFFMALAIPFALFVILHMTMLTLDTAEAWILAMLNAIVYVVAGFVLVAG